MSQIVHVFRLHRVFALISTFPLVNVGNIRVVKIGNIRVGSSNGNFLAQI